MKSKMQFSKKLKPEGKKGLFKILKILGEHRCNKRYPFARLLIYWFVDKALLIAEPYLFTSIIKLVRGNPAALKISGSTAFCQA